MQNIMVKVDPKLEVKIKEAKKLIAKMALDKLQFAYTLEEKIYDALSLLSWLRYLNAQKDRLRYLLIKETKKMDLLQVLLDKFRYADNTDKKKSMKECLSAQEMNNHRQKLQCRMGHGSKCLRKKMQLLKDMKPSQQEDKSFWTHYTDRLDPVEQRLLWHHQMPVLNITRDAVEECIIKFRDSLWRIRSCGVALGNDYESIVTHNVKGNSIVKEENWSLLDSKVALQEQIKVAREKIDEIRKTQLALGLGKTISEVERESKAMEEEISRVESGER